MEIYSLIAAIAAAIAAIGSLIVAYLSFSDNRNSYKPILTANLYGNGADLISLTTYCSLDIINHGNEAYIKQVKIDSTDLGFFTCFYLQNSLIINADTITPSQIKKHQDFRPYVKLANGGRLIVILPFVGEVGTPNSAKLTFLLINSLQKEYKYVIDIESDEVISQTLSSRYS